MTDTPTEIWRRMAELESNRLTALKEAMCNYDAATYLPAMKVLRAECGAIGHSPQGWYDTGFGRSQQRCNQCGESIEASGPGDDT